MDGLYFFDCGLRRQSTPIGMQPSHSPVFVTLGFEFGNGILRIDFSTVGENPLWRHLVRSGYVAPLQPRGSPKAVVWPRRAQHFRKGEPIANET
jgi:hypothetical protein